MRATDRWAGVLIGLALLVTAIVVLARGAVDDREGPVLRERVLRLAERPLWAAKWIFIGTVGLAAAAQALIRG